MNRAEIVFAMVEMARQGQAMSADEALEAIATKVKALKPTAPEFETDLEALLGIGAYIWHSQKK